MSVLLAGAGPVELLQDFTDNTATLESVIQKINAAGVTIPVHSPDAKVAVIVTAAKMLGAFPQKKALMYFAAGMPSGDANQEALKSAITAATTANVAIYPIDVSAVTPTTTPAGGGRGGASLMPAGMAPEEYNRRVAQAQARFGSAAGPMPWTYIAYGPPDQIDDRSSNAQNPSQIWRYNYLENFHSSVELEFPVGNGPMRINYPTATATFEGTAGLDPEQQTDREILRQLRVGRGILEALPTIGALPGRHASVQIYLAGSFSVFSVPLDFLSGTVVINEQIRTRTNSGSSGQTVVGGQDRVQAAVGVHRSNFTLSPGLYDGYVSVSEQATNRAFAETIHFEVK